MIKHIVLWTLKPVSFGRSAQENVLEIKSRLESLGGKMPGLTHIEVGIDFSRTDASADVAVYCEFVDRAALDAYQVHPDHVAIAGFIGEVRETRIVIDYEV